MSTLNTRMVRIGLVAEIAACLTAARPIRASELRSSVSWLGNSSSGASNRWVRHFFIHTKVQPDGTVNTSSHGDEGGKKFEDYTAEVLLDRWKP